MTTVDPRLVVGRPTKTFFKTAIMAIMGNSHLNRSNDANLLLILQLLFLSFRFFGLEALFVDIQQHD